MSSFIRTRQALSVLLLCAFVPPGCGGDGGGGGEPRVLLEIEVPDTVRTAAQADVTVRAMDPQGLPVPRLDVTFEVVAGGGRVVSSVVRSDGDGIARGTLLAGAAPVRNRVRVGAEGADSAVVTILGVPSGRDGPEVFAQLADASTLLQIYAEDIAFDGGGHLYFGTRGGIGRVDVDGREELVVEGGGLGRVAGIAIDREGRIFGADGGADALVRIDPDGTVVTLASEHEGQPFDAPNFVALDGRGNAYFSDPCDDVIFRVGPNGRTSRWLEVEGPNGFAFSETGDALWIVTEGRAFLCDLQIGPEAAEPVGDLLRVPLDGGMPSGPVEIIQENVGAFGDGIAFDVEGNLYTIFDRVDADFVLGIPIALQIISELWVRTPEGEFQRWFASDDVVWANVAFGEGDFDARDLYLSEFLPGNRIFRISAGIPGLPLIP